jgi:S-formylglutathione hydrolase FrmB
MLLGWIDPVVIDKSTEGLLVPNSHDHPFAVKINGKNTTNGRYFLIENRIQKGYDSGGYATIPGSGLLIYHIDEYDTPWSHVEQADGRQDLEEFKKSDGERGNPADTGDFFPGATNNSSFDRDTTPSSREDDGSDTGVGILEISPPLDTMRLSVELRGLPAAAPEGRWVEDKIHSSSLEDAVLSLTTDRTVRVYLPAAYDEFPDARFPVLYVLPPSWTTETYTWMDLSQFIDRFGAGPTLDAAFGVNGIRPMIVVFPDALGQLPHYYTNSHVVGNWEDFVVKDLVSYIDETYRTIPEAASRGISGLQLGGYGAIMIGMGHPDIFRAVYALASVDVAFEENYRNLTEIRDAMKEVAAHPPRLIDFSSLLSLPQIVVAACLSFAPDSTASPLPCNLPFDADGNVIEDVWDEWLRHDPYTLLHSTEYRENLHELNGLGFDCGPGVTFNINANRLFAQALRDAGVRRELREYREYVGNMADLLDERIKDYVIPFISDHVEGQIVTSIDGEGPRDRVVPRTFALHQNYPNPFNPDRVGTTIRYDLPEAASVRLTVFDALGRRIRVLGTGYQVRGTHSIRFDAAGLPSGIYFYRLEAGPHIATRSLVLTE